eukprot:5986471-Prymnesium_polylepis.1
MATIQAVAAGPMNTAEATPKKAAADRRGAADRNIAHAFPSVIKADGGSESCAVEGAEPEDSNHNESQDSTHTTGLKATSHKKVRALVSTEGPTLATVWTGPSAVRCHCLSLRRRGPALGAGVVAIPWL